jgi:hypothetical protein
LSCLNNADLRGTWQIQNNLLSLDQNFTHRILFLSL